MYTIIISSKYLNNDTELNNEVITDAETVKQNVSNYIEITFPVNASPRGISSTKIHEIKSLINDLISLNETEVQLILNTHGIPGHNDLDNKIVIELIKRLVNHDIQIRSLCALMCDGFTKETLKMAEQRHGYKFTDRFGGMSLKSSSMGVLRRKINALELKTEQNFIIRGFDKAYDSIINKNDVIELLRGNGGLTLQVNTRKSEAQDQKIKKIQKAIAYVSAVNSKSTTRDDDEWNEAANCLGLVFKEMLEEIQYHFYAIPPCALSIASQRLYERIKFYAISEKTLEADTNFVNNKEFLIQYKAWGKINLLKNSDNNQRLKLLNTYCNKNLTSEGQHRFFDQKNSDKETPKEIICSNRPSAPKLAL